MPVQIALCLLYPSNWQEERGIHYAEKETQELRSFFNLDDGRQIQRWMREHIDLVRLKSVGEVKPAALKELKHAGHLHS